MKRHVEIKTIVKRRKVASLPHGDQATSGLLGGENFWILVKTGYSRWNREREGGGRGLEQRGYFELNGRTSVKLRLVKLRRSTKGLELEKLVVLVKLTINFVFTKYVGFLTPIHFRIIKSRWVENLRSLNIFGFHIWKILRPEKIKCWEFKVILI